MKAAAHQEKEKNKKAGKRKAEEEIKQRTDFKQAACCPSAVVQGAAMVCVRGVPGITGLSGKPTAILTQPKRGRTHITTLRWRLIGAE